MMFNPTGRGYIAVLAAFSLSYMLAASPAIGTASARGSLRIDGSSINGNASLFDGSAIETDAATTTLHIGNGINIQLASGSRGKVFHDHLLLERGDSEFTNLGSFQVQANTINVSSSDSSARGVIRMKDSKTIEVASLNGGFDVKSQGGFLLGKVIPGRSLAFSLQDGGATAPTTVAGMLTKKDGNYFLTAPGSGLVYQVSGKNLDNLVGKNVTINGTLDPNAKPVRPASSVLIVASASKLGGAAAAGMAGGTKLIIAGVVVAAATGTGVGIYQAQQNDSTASVR